MIDAHPVDKHFGFVARVRQCCDAASIVNASIVSAHSQVKDKEEGLLEVVAYVGAVSAGGYGGAIEASLVLGSHGKVLQIVIHRQELSVPLCGDDVILVVLQRVIFRCQIAGAILFVVSSSAGSPVQCCTKVSCLRAVLYTFGVTRFNNVYLATAGPSQFAIVVTHHPVGRPYAVGCLRKLDACLYDAMFKVGFVAAVDTS